MIDELKDYCEDYLKAWDEYDKVRYLSKYGDGLEKRVSEKEDECVKQMLRIGIFLGVFDD